MNLQESTLPSPLGEIVIFHDGERLMALGFRSQAPSLRRGLARHGHTRSQQAAAPPVITDALSRYFAGDLGALSEIEIAADGTEFQKLVWQALLEIPAGETRSYREVAASIGRPTATRAVARANATNPISLVVPCHRVIRADGDLSGYGGGRDKKRWLLDHEGARPSLF